MKKLKDFLYDNNDILVAFAILVVAALLIVWRMSAIIEYPKTYINDGAVAESPDNSDAESGDSSGDSNSDANTGDGQSAPADNDDSSEQSGTDKDDDKDSSADKPTELWSNGKLSKTVEVSVYGDTASSALQCLIDVGLFKDYAEYQSACDSLGIDHQKVSAGVFSFEKGSTKNDIARAINWS